MSQNNAQQAPMYTQHEPLQFSAMSDYQIVEAIEAAGQELETVLPNFQVVDERTGLDWLDWFNMENNGNGHVPHGVV